MSAARDPYEVLGVPRSASTRQIRAAYVARARRAHPDLVGQRGLDMMRAINEAWEVLKDDARRRAFDLATGGPGAGDASGPATGAGPGAARREDANVPFWTGANGPPPGRPYGSVLDFGIYAGWSLGEVMRRDRGYLQWLQIRPEGEALRAEIGRMLNPDVEETPDPREKRKGRFR